MYISIKANLNISHEFFLIVHSNRVYFFSRWLQSKHKNILQDKNNYSLVSSLSIIPLINTNDKVAIERIVSNDVDNVVIPKY